MSPLNQRLKPRQKELNQRLPIRRAARGIDQFHFWVQTKSVEERRGKVTGSDWIARRVRRDSIAGPDHCLSGGSAAGRIALKTSGQ